MAGDRTPRTRHVLEQEHRRTSSFTRDAVFYLSCGVAAIAPATLCTLLVQGVTAKRLVWVSVLVAFGVGAGIVRVLGPVFITRRRRMRDHPRGAALAVPPSPRARPRTADRFAEQTGSHLSSHR